jgi:hypothetical protein
MKKDRGDPTMGFFEDDLVKKTQDIETEARIFEKRRSQRRKFLLLVSLIVVLIGGTIAYIHLTATSEENLLPPSPESRQLLVNKWKSVGLIKHLDIQLSICLIDDEQWNAFTDGKRTEIAITLGTYCAEINKGLEPRITIKSFITNQILLRLNDTDEESTPPVQSPEQENN